MVTLLAGGAACLGLYNGAGWSRERKDTNMTQSGFRNGWPAAQLSQSTQTDFEKVSAGLLLGDIRSMPHAIRTESMPSLIDVMHDKW